MITILAMSILANSGSQATSGLKENTLAQHWTIELPYGAKLNHIPSRKSTQKWSTEVKGVKFDIEALSKSSNDSSAFSEVVNAYERYFSVIKTYPERSVVDKVGTNGAIGYLLICNAGNRGARYGFSSVCIEKSRDRLIVVALVKNPQQDQMKFIKTVIESIGYK